MTCAAGWVGARPSPGRGASPCDRFDFGLGGILGPWRRLWWRYWPCSQAGGGPISFSPGEPIRPKAIERQLHSAANDEKYRSLLQDVQHLRLSEHRKDWSKDAWVKLCQAAEIHKDDLLRDQITACLAGLDAVTEKEFNLDATSVAFDKDGKRLLLGGTTDPNGKPKEGARLWEGGATDLPRSSRQGGAGPVTFTPEGTPLQLVVKDRWTLRLWDMGTDRAVRVLLWRQAAARTGDRADGDHPGAVGRRHARGRFDGPAREKGDLGGLGRAERDNFCGIGITRRRPWRSPLGVNFWPAETRKGASPSGPRSKNRCC